MTSIKDEPRPSTELHLQKAIQFSFTLLFATSNMENQLFDVIIVGRGPVGLFLACELRLQRLSVLVVERRTRTGLDGIAETRACVLHGRTLEILENRGLLDKFMEKGMRVDWWHYGVLDTRLQFGVFSNETKQNCVLFHPQYKTEEILLQRAEELGAVVQLGMHVASLEQSDTSVTIHGKSSSSEASAQGSPFTARGKYLVGTDGARSAIRSMADFGWDYNAGTDTLLSVEATVGVEIPKAYILKNGRGLVIACRLNIPSRRTRIVVWTPSRGNIPLSTPATLEDLNQALEEVTGTDYELSNPCMLTRFSNESGCVTAYRKGRILLGGDAGHRHLPAGGQGMNLGIQETNNLGWKLGAVVRGDAPDSLLDTYESERLPVAKGVVNNTTSQSLLFFAHTRPEMALREAMNKLLEVPEANRSLAREISGFGYSYPKSLDMIIPDGWEVLPEEMAGKRSPDIKLRVGSGDEKYLREYLREGKWVQLRFLDKLTGRPAVPAFDGRTEVVGVATILEQHGSMHGCALSEILIRPDGHFGFGKR